MTLTNKYYEAYLDEYSPSVRACHNTYEHNKPRTSSCGCQTSDTLGTVQRCERHTQTLITERNKERSSPGSRKAYSRPYGQS